MKSARPTAGRLRIRSARSIKSWCSAVRRRPKACPCEIHALTEEDSSEKRKPSKGKPRLESSRTPSWRKAVDRFGKQTLTAGLVDGRLSGIDDGNAETSLGWQQSPRPGRPARLRRPECQAAKCPRPSDSVPTSAGEPAPSRIRDPWPREYSAFQARDGDGGKHPREREGRRWKKCCPLCVNIPTTPPDPFR